MHSVALALKNFGLRLFPRYRRLNRHGRFTLSQSVVREFRNRRHAAARAYGYSSISFFKSGARHYGNCGSVSWNEPTILEQRFKPGVRPEEAVFIAADLLHEDYAYAFEAFWDLWKFDHTTDKWALQPSPVQFFVHGSQFDEGATEQEGNIQVDFGLDSPFLQENLQLTAETEQRVRANVQKLVEFTNAVEKNAGTSTRLLWSESDENFAQKLISRLQKVH